MSRLRFTLLLPFVLLAHLVVAQGFTITHFHSDIYLRRDGSFKVKERIEVEFTEQKHGIFRSIPFKYSTLVTESTLAKGRVVGQPYTTYLDSLDVPGQEFKVTEEGDYKKLRIGSGDTYVTGAQTYELSYIVYGAINRFLERDELYWNVNGTEWPASADSVSVTVHLPDPKLKIKVFEYKVFTGKAGERGYDASVEIQPGRFTARSKRRFEANEGLTIGLSLPRTLLKHQDPPLRVMARNYLYDSIHTTATLNADGSITVEEYLVLDIFNQLANFDRLTPSSFGILGLQNDTTYTLPQGKIQLHAANALMPDGYQSKRFATVEQSPPPSIQLGEGNSSTPDRMVMVVKYTFWETSRADKDAMVYYLPWLGAFAAEPVRTATIQLRWPIGCSPVGQGVTALGYQTPNVVSSFDAHGGVARLTQPNMPGEAIFWGVRLQGPGLKPATPPLRLTGSGNYHDAVEATLEVAPDGRLYVYERILLSNEGRPTFNINRAMQAFYNDWQEPQYALRAPTLFGNPGSYLIGGLSCEQDCEEIDFGTTGRSLNMRVPLALRPQDSAVLGYHYWLYGLLKREGAHYLLHFPLVTKLEDPVEHVRFKVILPGKPALTDKDYAVTIEGPMSPYPIAVTATYKDGVLQGTTTGLVSGQYLDVRIKFPADLITPSYWMEFRLFFHNQFVLCLCVLLSLLIAVSWYRSGRDKRFTIVPAFLPPSDLTPAEAGLLFDGHLNDRDILSLIYYWGAMGLLRIEEIDKDGKVVDYRLHKLKALPMSAKDFEKTIFSALFDKKDSVSVSSLKEKFYVHMANARTQIEAHATKKGFFVPGTQAYASLLFLLGCLVGGVTLIWSLVAWLGIADGVFYASDILLGLAILSGAMLGFSFVMPKHGPFGHKRYVELMGFHEFLDKAERDRLRLLQDENPDYFGLTLSFAISLGMANRWVEKFGPLLTAPPTYYSAAEGRQFDTMVFNTLISNQLRSMSTNFTSKPPPPPGSGGGSSTWRGGSSGGSSYRSSSSYSGGGSSYSSGGSSGGGYGGGGGGSW
jgi:uncharacterized membrane protein YgcG